MKHMKKLFGLLLAVVMVFAMSVSVFADDTNKATVSIPQELSSHTFVAYQIFTGTQTEGSGALCDAEWGNGIDSAKFLEALKKSPALGSKFASCTNAKEVVAEMSKLTTAEAEVVAKIAYVNKDETNKIPLTEGENLLAKGYYLIVDATDVTEQDMAANAALLKVTNDINITKKTDSPSVEKKVKENSKTIPSSEYGEGYNDVADYHMGDAVPFHLIGTIPDMQHYDTYKYEFYDTLGAGFTAPAKADVKVYLSTTKALDNSAAEVTGKFDISVAGNTITATAGDLKSIVANASNANNVVYKYVIVEYSAVLNQNAEVGLPGNENEVYLKYSNKPDQSGTGDTAGGKTPEDKVIVFTYELDVTKVNKQNKSEVLKDAEFKLRRGSDNKYVIVDAKGKVTDWADYVDGGSTLKSDAKGKFSVIGLDDGTYYLEETKAPAGYNKLTAPITIEIKATTNNSQNWDAVPETAFTEIKINVSGTESIGDKDKGSVGATVENSKGGSLPETGGIGTTIFYVVGGILMAAAAILLITKKKMSNK